MLDKANAIKNQMSDMDALPLQEANQVSYASQNAGVMHACGHDGHMAIALGVAVLLFRENFPISTWMKAASRSVRQFWRRRL